MKNNNCFTCEQFKIPKVCLECRNSFRDKALEAQREEIKGVVEEFGNKQTHTKYCGFIEEKDRNKACYCYNQALYDIIKKI